MFNLLTSVVGFIVAIGILVVIHELGHYTVARLCGVKVLRFSIGFGRPIWRYRSRVDPDATEWTLCWLPLGGYVRMLDERDPLQVVKGAAASKAGAANGAAGRSSTDAGHGADLLATEAAIEAAIEAEAPDTAVSENPTYVIDPRDLPRAFNRQSVGKRFAIVAAGPIANFLLAIVLLAGLSMVGQPEPEALIATPAANTAAAAAGLTGGDRVVALRWANAGASDDEATPVQSWPALLRALPEGIAQHRDAMILTTQRDGNLSQHRLSLSALHPPAAANGAEPGSGPLDAASSAAVLSSYLGLRPGGTPPVVAQVEPGQPGAHAGLRAGDEILAVDGQPVDDAMALVHAMRGRAGQETVLTIVRADRHDAAQANAGAVPAGKDDAANAAGAAPGQRMTVRLIPESFPDAKGGPAIGRIGVALAMQLPMVDVRYGPFQSLGLAVNRTWDVTATSLRMFGQMLVGKASLRNLSGPVTIADYAGRSARMGVAAFISFLALVSVSIGVLNLLPIPVLDGGHLLYYAVEAMTGRAVSERWQGTLQRAGLLCIVAMSVIALFNDLTRLAHS